MIWYHRFRYIWRYPEIWVLTGLALVTRLWQLDAPRSIVFDEVYFRTFASDYLSGHYFFDIHPPLVKLIFAGMGSLFHLSADQVASAQSGEVVLRLLPALAGAALVPMIYILLRQFRLSRRIATLGAVFILFDNALLVESRFVLMDSLLLLTGFAAISTYWVYRKASGRNRWIWLSITALLLGVLISIKWTGLAIVGLIGATWLYESVSRRVEWQRMLREIVCAFLIIATVYIGSFAVHFALLSRSGEGDVFMSERFQTTLQGNQHYNPKQTVTFWDKFTELNHEMYSAQSSLTGVKHPYSSEWYSWPWMMRPVYYWQGQTAANGLQGNIYLLGNPVVWFAGLVSVVVVSVALLVFPKLLGNRWRLAVFLVAGYLINFIPFAFINRPMFLYHYLFAFVISILLFCVLADRLLQWQRDTYSKRAVLVTYVLVIAMACVGFVYFAALSYGWPMSQGELLQRIWLPTWR